MLEESDHEKIVGKYYDDYWSVFTKWWPAEETLGIHLGLYEKGIKNPIEAVYNMNDFVGNLLGLGKKKKMKILDAGCGVGGSSIYLSKKYPNVTFIGITIAPEQVKLAKKFAKERNAVDTRFLLRSFIDTKFPDNYFDGIFALESSSYAENHNAFVDEMYRVLKHGGWLVVIDGFRTGLSLNSIMQKIYNEYCIGYGYVHLPGLKSYKEYLEEKGFTDIRIKNISKNVSPALFRDCVIAFPFFLSKVIKRIMKPRKYGPTDDLVGYSRGTTSIAGFLGFSGAIGYYATSAVKK